MPNIADSLKKAAVALDSAGIRDPRREAVSLLCFALGRDRAFLIAHPEYRLSADDTRHFDSIVKRRAAREPYHHITGVKEFYGLDFIVSPDVLIPRPETEMLVSKSIDILAKIDKPAFCDVGVGTGCISVSVLHHIEAAKAVGVDESEAAITIAGRNAEINGVGDRLELLHSDLFEGLGKRSFDLIVSNPPYIPAQDIAGLQPEVRDFEPVIALTDGLGGLSIIEKIVRQSPGFLNAGGSILLEIGIGQADDVTTMFDTGIWENIDVVPDFQGIPRMAAATLKLKRTNR